jgi:hypothetical protein
MYCTQKSMNPTECLLTCLLVYKHIHESKYIYIHHMVATVRIGHKSSRRNKWKHVHVQQAAQNACSCPPGFCTDLVHLLCIEGMRSWGSSGECAQQK